MVGDPAGLLRRIAELRPLCEDPAIAAAVESGDPFKVYRALVWARLTGRLKPHREALDALVQRRRLFAKALDGSPALATFNGFGAGFVGSDETDADGSYVTTHCGFLLEPELLGPFERYVRGEASSLPRVPAVFRAAAELVRSRNPGLPESERRRLVAAAKADDWLHTNVTRAVDGWTRTVAGR